MKVAFSPYVVMPLVFGIGLIALLLGYANAGQVLRVAGAFQPGYLLLILLLTLAYEALRAGQWFLFLRVLNHREPWRGCVMSYMGGELAKVLPGGQYFQTYLLRQAQGFPIACSVAATTIIIWLEVVVCLVLVLLLGVGPWTWVRPSAVVLLAGIAVLVALLKRRPLSSRLSVATRRYARLRPAWAWYDGFAGCADALLRPRALAPAAVLSVGYITLAAMALWAIAAALGVSGIGWEQALVVYAFALGVGLIVPIPVDLGVTELSGLAALMAFGVGRADALTVMLAQRVLGSSLTGGISLAGLVVLRRYVAAALRAGQLAANESDLCVHGLARDAEPAGDVAGGLLAGQSLADALLPLREADVRVLQRRSGQVAQGAVAPVAIGLQVVRRKQPAVEELGAA